MSKMIWFNIKELERKLANDDFPDKLAFTYLLAFLLITLLVSFFPRSSSGITIINVFALLINLVVVIWGLSRTMEINNNGSNKDYLKRLLSLSFVTGARLIVYLILFSLVFKSLKFLPELNFPAFSEGIGSYSKLIVSTMASVGFYFMLINSFKRINEAEGNTPRTERVKS